MREPPMHIYISNGALNKLQAIIEKEDALACVRIRETKIGSCWNKNLQIVLRLSIDELDDDDVESQVASLSFVINKDLADQYGRRFSITLDPNQMPVVAALP